ncbi:hypothetical protein [Mumia zhuanghuii]|uniref:Peptidase S55 domain-containing protein n=1 Tax=Mumia zhuanghuii TaxID=2585211 RepID=A0A5C4MS79_9ACTN|nr:hypothetical protein [Mumia zhuanghuii]TNC45275.1 hypothetical protein FHE65_14865 [Mumia zhuanghuii]TNC48234.1 hypothetical protein FHE65_07755 [Mumia zhuanghuii]
MTAYARARRRPLTTVVALTAVTAATLAMTGPALADSPQAPAPAVGSACPAAFPVSDLVRPSGANPGTTVEGLTVSTGTTADTVTGEFVGTLEDGIAPGVDMLIFKMSGSRITNAAGAVDRGIWAGMSGTPLYAADGRLVGAVSYGLSYAPSEYAGVTPAADLYRAGSYGNAAAAAPLTPKVASAMRSAGARPAAATGSMRRLPTPVGVPAGLTATNAKQVAKKARLKGVTFRSGGAGGRTSAQKIAVSAGSNVAASYSYGSVPLAGVGTTTAVCGSTVYAFGHPMDWVGKTKLSLHGADAVYVERDVEGSFKLANIGAPMGTFTQDRLAAIVGNLGAAPTGAKVTTTNRFGTRTRTSSSTVVSPDWISGLAALQSMNDSYVVTDGTFGGEARATRTIRLRRANGQILTYRRTDMYADRWDITAGAAHQLAGDIETLLDNDFEPVTIVDATQTSTVNAGYEAYTIGRVQAKQFGRWTTVDDDGVMARRGGKLRLRVTLVRDKGAAGPARKVVNLKVAVPRKKLKSPVGILTLSGGTASTDEMYYDEYSEEYYSAAGDATGLPSLLRAMSTAERGNDVSAVLSMGSGRRAVDKTARKATATVVSGGLMIPVIRYGKSPKKR